MKEIKPILEELKEKKIRQWKDFPDIDLYMDQVLSIMEDQLIFGDHTQSLSSSMVNNYVKADLLARANKKKYAREHLARLSMIGILKQVIPLKELENLFQGFEEEEEEVYGLFCQLLEKSKQAILEDLEEEKDSVILEMAIKSYLYRAVAIALLGEEK